MNTFKFSIKDICEISILVAIAIVIDTFIKIPIGATGGSINFSIVPLIVIALRHGPFKSFIASAIIFGLITCLIDGYGFNTYPLEYFVSYGIVSLIGLFSKKIVETYNNKKINAFLFFALIIVIITIIRLSCAIIDSIIFYEVDFKGALLYNIPYIIPSMAFDLVLSILLLPSLMNLNNKYKTSYYL